VWAALRRAVPVFFSGGVLAAVLLPLAVAAIVFVAVGVWRFDAIANWLAVTALDAPVGSSGVPTGWGVVAAVIATFLGFVAAALVAALVGIAVFAMPMIVRTVAVRDYPALERRRGGTFAGSVANALLSVAVFVPLWLGSLFLLAVPPLFVVASLLLSGWLNQRLLRYDALAEHADAAEMRTIVRRARGRLFGLGLALAPLSYVPLVNFVAPLYAGVAFTYLCLDELAALRAAAGARAPER
jgi:CysZ protein